MKKLSVKDFIIGALTATLFFMLLGATPNNNKSGRYTSSAGAAQEWVMVCVTDTLTGDTRCDVHWPKRTMMRGGDRFNFTPDFTRK